MTNNQANDISSLLKEITDDYDTLMKNKLNVEVKEQFFSVK